jgi:multiple sugar transport system permease protein
LSARNIAGGAIVPAPTHKTNRWRDNHDRFVGFLLLMPLVALILGLTVYPIAQVMQLSTQRQGLFLTESTFVGLQNFQNVVQHEAFGRSVKNSFTFAFGSLALQMAIGLAVALLLNRQFPLRTPIRGAMLFSYLVPYVVAAMT